MVHQYKNNGYDIVLDVNSGAVHVVDDVTYDVIALYAGHSKRGYRGRALCRSATRKTEMEEALMRCRC